MGIDHGGRNLEPKRFDLPKASILVIEGSDPFQSDAKRTVWCLFCSHYLSRSALIAIFDAQIRIVTA